MELYWTILSPPCRAVKMVADTIGVSLETKEVNVLTGENKTAEFTKLNPQQQVPLLVDGDVILPESRAIIEYLVDTYAKDDSLYPKNPKIRAKIKSRLYFDCGTLCPKLYTAYNDLFYGKPAKEADVASLRDSIQVLEGYLNRDKWVAGPNITIADISLVAIISGLPIYDFDLSPFPKVQNWIEECKKNIPSYKINEEGDSATVELLKQLSQPK
uniref:GSTd4 n=1 Tax=Liposcelis entomophila TaxID=550478 RepID=A0A1J0F4S1_9NEOP|nr:GSTd4 [Liposcelis entomophila]